MRQLVLLTLLGSWLASCAAKPGEGVPGSGSAVVSGSDASPPPSAAVPPSPADASPSSSPVGVPPPPADASLADRLVSPTLPDAAATVEDSGTQSPVTNDKRASFLAQLLAIVGAVPALNPQLGPATTAGAIVQQDFTISSTPTWRVPGTLRRPAAATGKLPVLICLHATDSDRDSPDVVSIVTTMTGRGFLTVAISGRYFGQPNGNNAYIAAMKAAYAMPGKDYPFLYDTVWDVMRTIDYLVTRDDVDPARIGLTGISKGGMETYLAAAVDTRVAAAAPIIGIQSFKWELENNAFQARAASLGGAVPNANDAASVRLFYDRVAPGLVDLYDCPDMLPLVAPRPFIVLSGTQDPRNPIASVQISVDAASPAYSLAGVPDRLKLFTADVGHDGSYAPFHDQAMAWIGQWLGR